MRQHVTDFWKETFKQLGVSAVLLAILLFYYSGENKKWETMQKVDSERWQQLFDKYTTDQAAALATIRECCYSKKEH